MRKNPIIEAKIFDETSGLEGFVVVDTMVKGRALGGTRIAKGVSIDEVKRLARGMTLKLSLADMAMGGCKGGINCALPPSPQRDDVLKAFGRSVRPLLHGGVYLGTDLGCTYQDRQTFHDAADFPAPVPKNFPCSWPELWKHLGAITGHGAFEGSRAFIELIPKRDQNKTVCIQGFGKAGQSMAIRYAKIGYRIVAVADIDGTLTCDDGFDVDFLIKNSDETGRIDRRAIGTLKHVKVEPKKDAWLDIDCGIIALAARGDAVTDANQERIRARILVEAANHPVTESAIRKLHSRGVHILPDIAVNCGSAIATSLIFVGPAPLTSGTSTLVEWCYTEVTKIIHANMAEIFNISQKNRISLHTAAMDLAYRKASEIHGIDTTQDRQAA